MAACGSLRHIFEKPLPENPTLLESLSSWNQIKSTKPIEDSSFTEIFGELHFKESSTLPLSSSSSSPYIFNPQARVEKLDKDDERSTKSPSSDYFSSSHKKPYHKNCDSFSSMNSESLQLCTEGLGFESSDDVEDLKTDMNTIISITKHTQLHENWSGEQQFRRSKTSGGEFPPPISSIGESGKPWVCFRSYRQDGRFVLKEIRIPNQEFLHARREDGRLKLQFFQADEEEATDVDDDSNGENDDYDDDERESEMIDGNEEENNEHNMNTINGETHNR